MSAPSNSPDFLPILLGSDINVYGMARAFHDRYGVVSLALTGFALAPTAGSRLVTVEVHEGFTTPDTFIAVLERVADRFADDPRTLLLVSCGDAYSELLSQLQERIPARFTFLRQPYELLSTLNYKTAFYRTCEQHGLPYPDTFVIERRMEVAEIERGFDLRFPVALKPADSVAYLAVDFPGRKKAYVIDDAAELQRIIDAIYAHGYTRDLILQDFIPGDDSHMRVLNAYVDRNHRVRMMSLGHPLLEDPSPGSVGNYMAILPEFDQQLYDTYQAFLEGIGYTGFANFDLKFDRRDGTYRVFELNPRQGRSSFYVTLGEQNLAEYLVRDYVTDDLPQGTLYANADPATHRLWLGLPRWLFKKYAADNEAKRRALELIRAGRWGSTLVARGDLSPRRVRMLLSLWVHYALNYRKYFRAR